MYQYLIIDNTGSTVYRSGHHYHTKEDAFDCGSYYVQEHYRDSDEFSVIPKR